MGEMNSGYDGQVVRSIQIISDPILKNVKIESINSHQ